MKLPQSGGCQCGQVRYEITEEPQLIYTCHCLDCQRLTSSAFSLGIVVPEKGFRLMGLSHVDFNAPPIADALTPTGLPGVRFLDLRHAEGWCSPRPGRHAGRYILAAAHEAHMDSQEAALGQAPRGR